MANKHLSTLFLYHHHIATSEVSFSELEKEISKKFANDLGLSSQDIKNQSPSSEVIAEYSIQIQLEYLYQFYSTVYKNYFINNKIEDILKKKCFKVGFFDSNINLFSVFLIECVSVNKPFKDVLKTIIVS